MGNTRLRNWVSRGQWSRGRRLVPPGGRGRSDRRRLEPAPLMTAPPSWRWTRLCSPSWSRSWSSPAWCPPACRARRVMPGCPAPQDTSIPT